MSAFTQGFNLGIMQGMSNMYAGLCNFWNFNACPFMGGMGFGGFGNWFGGFGFGFPRLYTYSNPIDFSPSLFVPQNIGGFTNYDNFNNTMYSTPSFSSVFMPTVTQYSFDSFINSGFTNTNLCNYDLSGKKQTSSTDTEKEKETEPKTKKSKQNTKDADLDFDNMLNFVLKSEGGYNLNDCGQPGNKGILQSTYDEYRKNKKLSTKDVKNIADEEVKDLYYTMYYKKSGADKISNKRLALYVFDTAVNMGVSAAKNLLEKCNNNPDKFNELRNARYESIAANNPDKKQYLEGWKNRVANTERYANDFALA